ncbi:hypothetical protein [Castellaniella caeni]|uniref:hypothetical protein n=1 Tax=Castellaniella caeni TaxID=266123 RepID=UPI000C9F4A8E|nr:hypothetical protein [Castellaniella caeni]
MLTEQPNDRQWEDEILNVHTLNRNSQVAKAARELCASGGSDKRDLINELLREARHAFHRYRPADQKVPELRFGASADEIKAAISDCPRETANKIIDAYGTLWLHEVPDVILYDGYENSVIGKRYLNCDVSLIESVAHTYLADHSLRSPTLEWAIINSLLYAETAAYMETLSTWTSTLSGFNSAHGISRWKLWIFSAARLSAEIAKLGVTALFSAWIGGDDRIVEALVFLSITAARWFVPTQKKRQTLAAASLASGMEKVHRLAKNITFNARAVREAAYGATRSGAIFSDYIFHLLDRRVREADSNGVF